MSILRPYNCPISKPVDINTASRSLVCCVIDSASHEVSIVYNNPTYYVFFCNSSPTDYNPAYTMMSIKTSAFKKRNSFHKKLFFDKYGSFGCFDVALVAPFALSRPAAVRYRRSAWDDKQIHSFHHNSSRLQPSW